MLFLVLMLLANVPCSPEEGTVVCHCKAGSVSACEVLRQTDPKKFADLEKATAQRANAAKATVQPTGELHHAISRRVAAKLDGHATLRGLYKPRDPRFVTRAKDGAAHRGYQDWHRKLDEEIIKWLDGHKKATPREFEDFLRELYSRPDMLKRFPNGL